MKLLENYLIKGEQGPKITSAEDHAIAVITKRNRRETNHQNLQPK